MNNKQAKNVPTQVHISGEDVLTLSPLGTTTSTRLMVGSMYCSKADFINFCCLMTPSMSRRRSVMSQRSRRTSRTSESVAIKIFISRSCRWREQTGSDGSLIYSRAALACFVIEEVFKKGGKYVALLEEAPCLQQTECLQT